MKTTKAKSKQTDDIKTPEKAIGVVANESKAVKKKPKAKKDKKANASIKQAVAEEVKDTAKELTVADKAKIEKKKAKKQAQKLKKQLRKATADTVAPNQPEEPKDKSSSEALKEKPASKKQKARPKAVGKGKDKDTDAVKRERDPEAEAATVFVGNLPINTKRVQITRMFQPYGTVNSIRLRTAGGKQLFKHKQRKGAGSLNAYVVLPSVEIAAKALAINGTEFKGNHLRVTPAAKSSGAIGGPGADGNDQASSDANNKRTIFVGNLKFSANEEKLREIFSSCGEIDYIRCLQDGEKGCKGVAYVCFQKPDAVGLALELNETILDDRPIHVEKYAVKKLGAKQARDAAAAAAVGSQSNSNSKKKLNSVGAKKRLDKKPRKENGHAADPNKPAANKKKSEYRGVKVDGINKKNKKPKKKTNNQMNVLAKKIAPKAKN